MGDELDRVTVARALLMQPVLRLVSELMPAAALTALRAEVARMRDEAARIDTPAARAMAEACDMALADLALADGLPPMAHRPAHGG